MTRFRPEHGEEDPNRLPIKELLEDENLCERTFVSKNEAFKAGLRHAGDATRATATGLVQLDANHRHKTIETVESLPWGDLDGKLEKLKQAISRAVQLTREDHQRWDLEGPDFGYEDELNISPGQLLEMTEEWRHAYIGALIHLIALFYGTGLDFPEDPWASSPAALLDDLLDIVHSSSGN